MGTAIKHPVPDRVKPSFVIFDIRTLWRSVSCTHMATVGFKGLIVRLHVFDTSVLRCGQQTTTVSYTRCDICRTSIKRFIRELVNWKWIITVVLQLQNNN